VKNIDFNTDDHVLATDIGLILDYEILCPGSQIGFFSGNPLPAIQDQEQRIIPFIHKKNNK
jgi:hypothetical protein